MEEARRAGLRLAGARELQALKLLGLKLPALPLEQELKRAWLPSGELQGLACPKCQRAQLLAGPEELPQALLLDLPDRR